MKYLLIMLLFLSLRLDTQAQLDKDLVLSKINKVRTQGCYCGRRWMEPAAKLVWNDKLEKSALNHAKDMDRNNFFGHYSSTQENIGTRIDKVGYSWKNVGENIAEGQESIDEVIDDWIKSRNHCLMLMNPKMTEMGLVKLKDLWVHHFGSPLMN
jgi:uncharacterized protein YkwD